jgi:FAD/FMN-containing dehydrogenase
MLEALKAVLGESGVLTAPADRALYERDWRGLSAHPALAVALPKNVEQVSDLVRLCAAHGIKIVPQGGNTGLVAGGVPVAAVPQLIVSLSRLTRIRAQDADTITVEAGATLAAVQEAAASAGRYFGVSFGAEGSATIGGAISTNAGGMRVLAYGPMRAQVLGLEVVLADGRIWNGLSALGKDNTGYDLKQLFIGAEGTLGLITAATLRLHPTPRPATTVLAGVDSPEHALQIFAALGPGVTLCEYMRGDSLPLSGAKLPFAAPDYLLIETSGDLDALTDGVIAQSEAQRLEFISWREAISEGELRAGGAVKHDISVPLARIPAMVHATEALVAAKYPGARPNIFGHLGDGNLHINIRPAPGQTLADLPKVAITAGIESLAASLGGSFSAEHGIGQFRLGSMVAHKSQLELDLMRRIRQALDPEQIFNPGKTIPEAP